MECKQQTIPSHLIKAEAMRLGFSACGIAKAEPVSKDFAEAYLQQIEKGKHATMDYLARNIDLRFDPTLLHEGVKTIISVALNYYPTQMLAPEQYKFAWYAYGKDYHDVVRARLQQLLLALQESFPHLTINGRAFCDTAPIPERYWAWRSGIGWIGRNMQLIIPRAGSCFFLGELFINAETDTYDSPIENHCGKCRRCIDACPMEALSEDGLDARRCLSYLTIENRGEIPHEAALKMGDCIYGCDRCQKACPHNGFAQPSRVSEFMPSEEFISMTPQSWHNLSVDDYRRIFKGSAVKRAKYEGLMRNIRAAQENGKESER